MPILKTYHDKINKATGADSDIPWEQFSNEQKERLIDEICNNNSKVKDITDKSEWIQPQTNYNSKIFTILNYNLTLNELMQIVSISLQIIAIIIALIITKKIK